MMENKVTLKHYLSLVVILSLFLLCLFLIITTYEYRTYTLNFNYKLSKIVSKIKEEYPTITENEIMEILNNKEENEPLFEKYSIDIEKDSLVLENERSYHKFLLLNITFFLITIILLVFMFLKYNNKLDKEIRKITKYIEEINKKNYTLNIDEISEDELSILKNEIYKTTIMLKESAENSLKDKKQLKKSLEDISHQLKTPLTSILIMLDNLMDNPDMDDITREDFLKDIKKDAMNINFFVQTILKLSKFDSNTIHFIKEENLVSDIINESIQNISTLCDLRNIKIEIIGDKKSKIYCDFKWQVEALTNVLKNCIDHSKDNEKIIINYEQNKVYTSIIIEDFGSGIEKEDLPHIFERFYKGKNATSDSIGIGLSLTKTIIEEDNGNITVKSSLKGTKFIIKYFS